MGTTAAIVLLLFILVALLYPLWRPPLWVFGAALGPAAKMAALQERKLSLYGAIREAGFDLRTDKISEPDYRTEVERLKAEAVEIVGQIESLGSSPPRGPNPLESLISAAGKAKAIEELAGQGSTTRPGTSEGATTATATATASATVTDAAPDGSVTGTDAAPAAVGTQLFCTRCGRQAAAEDRFCAGCGAELHDIA